MAVLLPSNKTLTRRSQTDWSVAGKNKYEKYF